MIPQKEVRAVEALIRAHGLDPWPISPYVRDASRDQIPRVVLCLDTETTTDSAQQLNFGVASFYRVVREGETVRLLRRQTWLLHDDYDLEVRNPEGLEILRAYARAHKAEIARGDRRANPSIALIPRGRFVEDILFRVAVWPHAVIAGANLPFDLSRIVAPHLRISLDAWEARTGMEIDGATGQRRRRVRPDLTDGGFSLPLAEQLRDGQWRENRSYPRVKVKKIGRGKAFIAWGKSSKHPCRASFIDALTLAGALSGRVQSLESACREFGLGDAFGGRSAKRDVSHGGIDPDYIDYCREDEAATAALLGRLLSECLALGIAANPSSLYSGASVAGDLLDRLGVPRRSDRSLGQEAIGAASAAYFGGRAECRVRHVPVPVVHTDVVAEYPAVSALMGLQRLLLARRVRAVEADPSEVESFLAGATVEDALLPETWKNLLFLALVEPRGDLLPVRSRWGGQAVGIGQALIRSSAKPLWYAGPDLLASAIRVPWRGRILKVLRLEADGRVSTLRPVTVAGRTLRLAEGDDLYVRLVEERERMSAAEVLSEPEQDRWRRFFKIVANSLYGKTAEANPIDLPKRGQRQRVTALTDERLTAEVERPEVPGPFSFMPIASLTTAGGRLLLAVIERLVTDLGGWWAFADTDSFAVIAMRDRQLIPCPGGQWYMEGGGDGIGGLSYEEVDRINERVNELNPFDRSLVPSLLALEDVNHEGSDPSRSRRQLYYFGIAAKRYTFHTRHGEDGLPLRAEDVAEIIEPSKHAIGTYADPDPVPSKERWERSAEGAWRWIIVRALHGKPRTPPWFSLPAVHDYNAARPRLLRAFAYANEDLSYAKATKPFSFLLTAEPSQSWDREEDIRLAAPFSHLPEEWSEMPWWNIRARGPDRKDTYRLVAGRKPEDLGPNEVLCRTYREVVASHSRTQERKSDGPDGKRCDRNTVGVLTPPVVDIGWLSHVGKDMNDLDEVRAGVRTSEEALLTYRGKSPSVEAVAVDRLGVPRVARATGLSTATVRSFARGAPTSSAFAGRIIKSAAPLARKILQDWGEKAYAGEDRQLFLQFATNWWVRVGRVAGLWEEALWALDQLSTDAIAWVAEMALVHPSRVRTVIDPWARADVVEAVAWAVEFAARPPKTFLPERLLGQRVISVAEDKVEQDFRRNQVRLDEAKDQEERSRIEGEIGEELMANSARRAALSRHAGSLTVHEVDPFEALVFQAFRGLLATGARPLCGMCFKPVPKIGDTICSRSMCRKRAARATLVEQLPLPARGRGRPRVARFRGYRQPDDGWAGIEINYATSKFRGRDPLPGRTLSCTEGRHRECPGRPGMPTEGKRVSLAVLSACRCRCHRPGRDL